MPNSYAETPNLTCLSCQQSFQAEVWQIIDTEERPDLFERLHTGKLYKLSCPHCTSPNSIDPPLLILQPNRDPPLLFIPPAHTDFHQNQQLVNALLTRLKQSMEPAWQTSRAFAYGTLTWSELRQVYIPEAFLTTVDHLANKAARFSHDFQHSHQLDSLDAAIQALRDILELLPMNSPQHPAILSNAGSRLINRYIHRGELSELYEGIHLCRRAVESIPSGLPIPPPYQNNLGIGLGRLYEAIGQHAFLDEAIERFRGAVSYPYSDAQDLSDYLNNLGIALRQRYHRGSGLADLNEAITVHKMAVQKTPDMSRLVGYLNNLSVALRTRYNHTDTLDDLDQAIRHCEDGLTYSVDDPVAQAYLFTTLAVSLRDRAARTGNFIDLNDSVELCTTALAKMPSNAPNRAMLLDNLGNSLRALFGHTKVPADLNNAIKAHEEAVTLTQEGSPYLPGYLGTLGNALSNRYDETHQAQDLENAKQAYTRACELGLNIAPDRVVRCARNWARWALSRQAWSEVITAFTYGTKAIDTLWGVQIDRPGQEGILALSRALAAMAAYALAKSGDLPKAVEVIEQGRARLLAEALEQNRSDLERLPTLGYSDLYERYQALCNQLAVQLPSDSMAETFDRRLGGIERLNIFERLSVERQAIISKIQQIAGYEDFHALLCAHSSSLQCYRPHFSNCWNLPPHNGTRRTRSNRSRRYHYASVARRIH
jgi:tetratricopeptide (TPR) repeat protein